MASNKDIVEQFFGSLWTDPALAKSLATDDVTWITTRSMPIPGAVKNGIEHIGWDAVLHVANSGKEIDTGYIPETLTYPNWRVLAAEDDHVVLQFTMQCRTKTGKDYINDYLFLVQFRDGKICRFQEYWDSKQAFDLLLA